MNTTHQILDRTSVIALALAAVTFAVAYAANVPAAPVKQATAASTATVADTPYKLVVTAQRLRTGHQVAGVALAGNAGRSL